MNGSLIISGILAIISAICVAVNAANTTDRTNEEQLIVYVSMLFFGGLFFIVMGCMK